MRMIIWIVIPVLTRNVIVPVENLAEICRLTSFFYGPMSLFLRLSPFKNIHTTSRLYGSHPSQREHPVVNGTMLVAGCVSGEVDLTLKMGFVSLPA